MSTELDNMLHLALSAAERATHIHREMASSGFSVTNKDVGHDKVTDADYRAEEAIVQTIRSVYPEHNILAEEGSYDQTSSPYRWIIDPLDGTVNYSRGIPVHSVSIAVTIDGRLAVGVVQDSFRNETFTAMRGGGAFLNDKPIRTSRTDRYEDAILISGFFYRNEDDMRKNLDTIGRFFRRRIVSLRRFGSAALDLCYVACGRVDGFWEPRLHVWDFAAATLIVEEAGGRVTNDAGEPIPLENGYVVASNGPFHDNLLDTIHDR